MIKIVDSNKKEYKNLKVPFIVKEDSEYYMIIYDQNYKYVYVDLETGELTACVYETLEELFEDNPNDIVVETEIHIL